MVLLLHPVTHNIFGDQRGFDGGSVTFLMARNISHVDSFLQIQLVSKFEVPRLTGQEKREMEKEWKKGKNREKRDRLG